MKNKNFDAFDFEKKVRIELTILALVWIGLWVWLFWKYHTVGCFTESGSYGISVDELSDYNAGKSIVLSLHDWNGYVKMIASDEVISIAKEE